MDKCLISLTSITSPLRSFLHWIVFYFFFYCVTVKTIYCRNKDKCPLDNKCLTSRKVYNAQVITNNVTKNYIRLTERTFKQRFSQHKATFKHRKYTKSTELSKYIWKLRENNQDFNIKWTIISRAIPYNNISKRYDLCLTEKLMIIAANPDRILNKRSELICKCRHETKFYLRINLLKINTLLVFFSRT